MLCAVCNYTVARYFCVELKVNAAGFEKEASNVAAPPKKESAADAADAVEESENEALEDEDRARRDAEKEESEDVDAEEDAVAIEERFLLAACQTGADADGAAEGREAEAEESGAEAKEDVPADED